MQRKYEVMCIVRPDMADEDVTKLVETLQSNATQAGAKVLTTENMGRKRLAYQVKGFADGNFVLLTVEAGGEAIHEVERRLRVNEPVIKFLTVRVDDSEKRAAKTQKLRASKVKRSVTDAANAAAAASAAAAEAATAAASAATSAATPEAAPASA